MGEALIRNKIIGATLIENAEIPIKIGKVFMKKDGRKADKLSKSLLPCWPLAKIMWLTCKTNKSIRHNAHIITIVYSNLEADYR